MLHYVTKNDKWYISKHLYASFSVIYGYVCQIIWNLCIDNILNTCITFSHMSNWCYFAFLIQMLHTLHITTSQLSTKYSNSCMLFGCILAKAKVFITLKNINGVTKIWVSYAFMKLYCATFYTIYTLDIQNDKLSKKASSF